jgi:hypothetical protein
MYIMGNDINIFLAKSEKKFKWIFFIMACNFFTACCEKIWYVILWSNFFLMMTWHLIPCHNSKIKNYVVQHVIIQNDLKAFH